MGPFAFPRNAIKALTGAVLALALSGCALSPFEEESVFRRASTTVGVTGKLAEPEPFVRDSRTGQTQYPPVGVTPQRPVAPRSADGVISTAAELDQLRMKNEAIAAAARPASPYDGKIEPGFKPPELPPVPAYTGPEAVLPAGQGSGAATGAATAAPSAIAARQAPSTKKKPNDKKGLAGSSSVRP